MDIASLLILVLFLGAMYFLLIRPQQKRQREHQQMVDALRVGEDVVTIGGIHGTVVAINDDSVDLEVTDDIVMRFQKSAMAEVVGDDAAGDVGDDAAGDVGDDADSEQEPVEAEADAEER